VRWAEKRFKTDVRYIVSSGGWSLAAQAVASLSTLALSIIVGHVVPKDVYGEYKYVVAVVSILSLFSLNDLGSAVLQSAAKGFDRALPSGFRINLRWSILIFAATAAFAAYYASAGNIVLAVGILIGGSLSPFMSSANLALSYLAGKKDFRRAALYGSILGNSLPVLALIATVLIAPHPLPLIIVYFVANAATDFWFYRLTLRVYHPERGTDDPTMVRYGAHLSVMGIIVGISQNIDQVLVFHFLGPIDLAIYAFSVGIVDQARGPLKNFDAMLRARFASYKTGAIDENMGNKVLWTFIAMAIGAGVYMFVAPYIYMILFPAYAEAAPYSQLYALTLLATVSTPLSSFLFAKQKTKALYIDNIVSSVLQIALMVAGLMLWGLWGLVLSRVVSRFAGSALTYILYRIAVVRERKEGPAVLQ